MDLASMGVGLIAAEDVRKLEPPGFSTDLCSVLSANDCDRNKKNEKSGRSEMEKSTLFLSAGSPNHSPPPSFCYLSIKKDKSYTGERLEKNPWEGDARSKNSLRRLGSLPPLITIAVPPNCHFIRDDDSVQLSTSYDSAASVGSSFEEDTCSFYSDKDLFPPLISPCSSDDSGQVDSSSESDGDELTLGTVRFIFSYIIRFCLKLGVSCCATILKISS